MKNVSELTANNLFNNCLYIYSGGGYDGCLWEWNAFLVNKTGVFTDIYSSGVFGIKVNDLELEEIISKLNDTDTFIYELDNETEILEFTSKYFASFVLSVGDRVNKIYSDEYNEAPVVFKCPMCGEIESIYLETAYGVGLEYLGDIAYYSAEQIICEDCYSEHTCDYCGDFHSDINEFFYSEDYGNVCEYCYEEKTEEGKLAKELKEKEEIEKELIDGGWESEEEKESAMNKLREIIARLDGE